MPIGRPFRALGRKLQKQGKKLGVKLQSHALMLARKDAGFISKLGTRAGQAMPYAKVLAVAAPEVGVPLVTALKGAQAVGGAVSAGRKHANALERMHARKHRR